MQAPLRVESGQVTTTHALTYRVSMNFEKPPVLSTKRTAHVPDEKDNPEIEIPQPSNPAEVQPEGSQLS